MAPPKGNSTSCVQQVVDCLCGRSLSPRAMPAQSLSPDVYVKPTHRPPPLPIMAAVFSRKVERVRMVLAQKPESVNAVDEVRSLTLARCGRALWTQTRHGRRE